MRTGRSRAFLRFKGICPGGVIANAESPDTPGRAIRGSDRSTRPASAKLENRQGRDMRVFLQDTKHCLNLQPTSAFAHVSNVEKSCSCLFTAEMSGERAEPGIFFSSV